MQGGNLTFCRCHAALSHVALAYRLVISQHQFHSAFGASGVYFVYWLGHLLEDALYDVVRYLSGVLAGFLGGWMGILGCGCLRVAWG